MLYSATTGKHVHIPANKALSDNMKRSVVERLEAPDHKHDKFFRLEERARVTQQ